VVLGSALALALSASAFAGVTASGDQTLADRVAPIASDLGSGYEQKSAATVHAHAVSCPAPATACTLRYFALPSDPPAVASAIAFGEVFATAARAAAADNGAEANLSKTRIISKAGIQETISLRSKANFAANGAHATLFVLLAKVTKPRRLTETFRSILVLEGRAQLVITYKAGRNAQFVETARRLIARMRPAA